MLTTEMINLEVESVQEKHEEKINKEKHDISLLASILKDNKQELEFVKKHGSNNQLFLALRKQITNIQKTDNKIHDFHLHRFCNPCIYIPLDEILDNYKVVICCQK
jgi:hypothetical protein